MKPETKVVGLPKISSDQPPQQQQVENKISKGDFRKMMAKEKMLNGKAFEDCSRMELLYMILSLGKAVNQLTTELNKYKEKDNQNKVEPQQANHTFCL